MCIVIGVGYANYQENVDKTTAMIKVKSGLSINYLNGNVISTNEDTYEINFSITNTSSSPLYYYIKLNNQNYNENVTYKLVNQSDNTLLKEDKITKNNLANRIKINQNETKSYKLILYNPSKNLLETEIEIDLEVIDHSLRSLILQNNEINTAPISYSEESVTNGLMSLEKDDNPIYYFRGNVTNNYLSFANLMWRIVKINSDGTTLIVLDDKIPDNSSFFINEEEANPNFLASNVYTTLANWYNSNLESYDSYIASSKYCTDDNALVEENGTIYYLPETRLFQNYEPVSTCPGTSYTSKIALLTADEVMMAGGFVNPNANYYLYKEGLDSYWTMTPNKKENGVFNYIVVNSDGALNKDKIETSVFAIRPVITLIKKLNTTGSGSITDPYKVSLI